MVLLQSVAYVQATNMLLFRLLAFLSREVPEFVNLPENLTEESETRTSFRNLLLRGIRDKKI